MRPVQPDRNAAIKKIWLRLIPFLFVLYIFNYLDRINIGFAALVDEQGSGADRDDLRAGEFDLLYRICRLRDSQQPVDGALWRPGLDRAHPDFMGTGFRRHHAGGRPQQPLSRPVSGRRAGGRLRARRVAVSDLLDPEFAPRPRQWLSDDGAAGGDGAGRRRVRPDPRSSRRHAGPTRLALAVPAGGIAGRDPRRDRLCLSDRQTRRRGLAGGNRKEHR